MQKRARIIWYRRLGVSVSAAVLCCSFATTAAAVPHYYQYAQPDESASEVQTAQVATGYYPYAQPADAEYAAAPARMSGSAEDKSLTYPPLASLRARRPQQAAVSPVAQPRANTVTTAKIAPSLPLNTLHEGRAAVVSVAQADSRFTYPPLAVLKAERSRQETVAREDKATVHIVQTELASAALVSQASVEKAAALALAESSKTELAGNATIRNLATLSPAAGQEIQVASASDMPSPRSTMPPIAPLPSSIASPSTPPPSAFALPALPPLNVPPLMMPAPAVVERLSDESRQILDKLPPEKKHASRKKPVAIDHVRKSTLEEDTEVRKHEGIGIKISIRRPKADINQMLESAYQSLIAGNQEEAIEIYKQVLDAQPENKLALFGLATTYHRAGQIQLARPLYGKLLAIDPHNVEGLNNFLVLLSDESPSEALVELTQLERTHPGFSPVPAQVAVIYEKIGKYDKAAEAMSRAIVLSPENLKYRYDMAIILDKQGAWADAASFYQQLITASDRGEKIPTNPEEIQERLTFIRSNKLKGSS